MGKSGFSNGTQIKERARQKKQLEKASKRMLVRQQKKAQTKTSPLDANSDITEPISEHEVTEKKD